MRASVDACVGAGGKVLAYSLIAYGLRSYESAVLLGINGVPLRCDFTFSDVC